MDWWTKIHLLGTRVRGDSPSARWRELAVLLHTSTELSSCYWRFCWSRRMFRCCTISTYSSTGHLMQKSKRLYINIILYNYCRSISSYIVLFSYWFTRVSFCENVVLMNKFVCICLDEMNWIFVKSTFHRNKQGCGNSHTKYMWFLVQVFIWKES